jgi:peptide/nickel transport system substrate-binding protein
MDEQTLRECIRHIQTGRLSRRLFVQMMIGLGLTEPLAVQLLAAGAAHAQPKAAGFTPTRGGGGGPVGSVANSGVLGL